MKHKIILTLLWVAAVSAFGQDGPRVLFIGNSYTNVNDLPQMVVQVAESMGETLSVESNTPGGCTFMQHCSNQSMSLIRQGGWSVVVLQEQSQYPSFPQGQVEQEVFPYAARLVDSVYAHSPCAEPMFYMTWGHQNGDPQNAQYFPVLGTYEGMDSMLALRYVQMAHDNDASLCPVGRVWRYIPDNYSDIGLYASDGSHPTVAGTYAAACAFYVMIFHRNPEDISYNPGLADNVAQKVRSAVREVVYERLEQWRRARPQATVEIGERTGLTVTLRAHTHLADSLWWDFGDGFAATQDSVVSHTYAAAGSYDVRLVAGRHCMADTATLQVSVEDTGLSIYEPSSREITIAPNPASDRFSVSTGSPDATVRLYDSRGRQLQSGRGSHVLVDVSLLPPGVYVLRVGDAVRKVVKR
ncbi:MAG: T9SS type A sorting domain-containing protein [Bacteroidales bacterium]|nr:T9SS type A sorting domain-containing protein [Bacteroidales bacterium]